LNVTEGGLGNPIAGGFLAPERNMHTFSSEHTCGCFVEVIFYMHYWRSLLQNSGSFTFTLT